MVLTASPAFQRLAILGSTGSIGRQTLSVVRQYPEHYAIVALSAGQQVETLAKQIQDFQPQAVAMATQDGLSCLNDLGVTDGLSQHVGAQGLIELATHPEVDTVVIGLVGIAGLAPTLAALKAGKRVLTANKETFVAGGHLVAPYLSQVMSFDSEHSALFQCLEGQDTKSVRTLWLTASGGPFRKTVAEEMAIMTPAQALAHPTWTMGPKVSIDSATLMNKGLEIIEAHWLFGVSLDAIEVVIHPQSIFHSLVEYRDGSLLAQLGSPDMRVPIQYALSYPHRLDGAYMGTRLSLTQLSALTFEPPDLGRFPCLRLARQAMEQQGQAGSIVLNAADEVVVETFLKGRIGFMDIPRWIEAALEHLPSQMPIDTEADVLALHDWTTRWLTERLP